jgi:myo-inositol-hexaphosphate 3-phosphohydrolase
MASSQGDNSFAVFDRQGTNAFIGSFAVAEAGGIDSVQESDGADVTPVALPGFAQGLFITQDGDNQAEGGTNFKGSIRICQRVFAGFSGFSVYLR